ncbi:hypothetical protein OIU79_030663 [Salix purpurea]|uniref:Uncharacterized protein n=1 Tax=Salix purpurea TaxID=77065 RepID=A0A9Q0V9V5_SALPP|nr:hypothetical protein OIU79_030663 [Salix purpurea]
MNGCGLLEIDFGSQFSTAGRRVRGDLSAHGFYISAVTGFDRRIGGLHLLRLNLTGDFHTRTVDPILMIATVELPPQIKRKFVAVVAPL